MAKEIQKPSGQDCPPGYVPFHYLGETTEQCRRVRRYVMCSVSTSMAKRNSGNSVSDYETITEGIKSLADSATWDALRDGREPWVLWDTHAQRVAYTGSARRAIQQAITTKNKAIARFQREIAELNQELAMMKEGF